MPRCGRGIASPNSITSTCSTAKAYSISPLSSPKHSAGYSSVLGSASSPRAESMNSVAQYARANAAASRAVPSAKSAPSRLLQCRSGSLTTQPPILISSRRGKELHASASALLDSVRDAAAAHLGFAPALLGVGCCSPTVLNAAVSRAMEEGYDGGASGCSSACSTPGAPLLPCGVRSKDMSQAAELAITLCTMPSQSMPSG